MIEPLPYREILEKLLEKTKAGRLDWKAEPGYSGEQFICQLDRRYTFRVRITEGGYGASMEGDGESGPHTIFSLTADDRIQYPDNQEKLTFDLIADLYEVARRMALNIPGSLSEVAELLDRV